MVRTIEEKLTDVEKYDRDAPCLNYQHTRGVGDAQTLRYICMYVCIQGKECGPVSRGEYQDPLKVLLKRDSATIPNIKKKKKNSFLV